MRIAFDGTTLRPGKTGVGYYTEHLLRHLAGNGSKDEYVVVSNRPIETARRLPSRVRQVISRVHVPRLVWMQAIAPHVLRAVGAEIAHFTNGMVPLASPVPTVVTIHDMSLTIHPRYHPLRRVLLNRPLVDLAARRAQAVITVSRSAKADIVRLYGLAPERVHVIHEAAAPEFQPVVDVSTLAAVRAHYGLADRVILYVGTIEPRKNLPLLLEAFARRRASGDLPHQLVCVGPYGWLSSDISQRIERLELTSAVRFTGYVPFEDLPALYSLSEMLVFPSLYEGFGLPVIEAMACGTPVIAGRNSSLGEVAGGAIQHLDVLEADALGEAMVAMANDRDRRDQLAAGGLLRARTFSWERAARATAEVYHLVARGGSAVAAALEPEHAYADGGRQRQGRS